MRYYLIAGEASGDLHATRLIRQLRIQDTQAQIKYHYHPELAYMGYIAVATHICKILRGLDSCKQEILSWKPDCVILIDYPGFNLKIAGFVHRNTDIPVIYYISPKIWAWKERRLAEIRRNITAILSILPFEVEWYAQRSDCTVHYVGNPSAEEIRNYLAGNPADHAAFRRRHELDRRPVIAILPGSREQEIRQNLEYMIQAAMQYSTQYQIVLAAAPTADTAQICRIAGQRPVHIVQGDTYRILQHSAAALVTSGTATLETALLGVPQVVCYRTGHPHISSMLRPLVLKIPYVSLVNLIAGRELVTELIATDTTTHNIARELGRLLPGGDKLAEIQAGYLEIKEKLGRHDTAANAARHIISMVQMA